MHMYMYMHMITYIYIYMHMFPCPASEASCTRSLNSSVMKLPTRDLYNIIS